jgi:predicted DNA-binding WGR domain protein
MQNRRLIYNQDSSNKFWEIELTDASFTVCFGRIGTEGQSQTKSFASAAEAKTQHDKLVNEKLKKGYVDDAATSSAKSAATVNASKATKAIVPNANTPNAKSVAAPSSKAQSTGAFPLDLLADAVEKENAEEIVKLFENVSETERAQIRKSLIEINRLYDYDGEAKPKALLEKKYPAEALNRKFTYDFGKLVQVAVDGQRNDVGYATYIGMRSFPVETIAILKGRSVPWIPSEIKRRVDTVDEWMQYVDAGILPTELDDGVTLLLLNSGLSDEPAAESLKKLSAKYPWINPFVYRACEIENWAIKAADYAQRLSGFLAFVDHLQSQSQLDRLRILRSAIQGMHLVQNQEHVKGCIRVVETMDPTSKELIDCMPDLNSVLTLGKPSSHEFVLTQFERLSKEDKLEASQAASGIASILPSTTASSAKRSLGLLSKLYVQYPKDSRECLEALLQGLLHTKRDISELAWNTIAATVDASKSVEVAKIKEMIPHVSQVLKKSMEVWLADPARTSLSTTLTQTTQTAPSKSAPKKTTLPKKKTADSSNQEAFVRSEKSVKAFRDAFSGLVKIKSLPIHLGVTLSTLESLQTAKKGGYLYGYADDIFDLIQFCHFGIPIPQSPSEFVDLFKTEVRKIFEDQKELKERGEWWNNWLFSFVLALATKDEPWIAWLVDWLDIDRPDSSYGRLHPDLCYLCALAACQFGSKPLAPKRLLQFSLEQNKTLTHWLAAFRAIEAADAEAFQKSFQSGVRQHAKEVSTKLAKDGYLKDQTLVSIPSTIMWHLAVKKGWKLDQLDMAAMAFTLTADSVPFNDPKPTDLLPLPPSKDRIAQSLKHVADWFERSNVSYALLRPRGRCDDFEVGTKIWYLVADLNDPQSLVRLAQNHDPFRLLCNWNITNPKRKDYVEFFISDLVSGVSYENLMLTDELLADVLKKSKEMKQSGATVASASIEHSIALALPVDEDMRDEVRNFSGKMQNRNNLRSEHEHFVKWIDSMTKETSVDWSIVEGISKKQATGTSLKAIRKTQ